VRRGKAGNNHSTHDDVQFPDWQPQVNAALLETNPGQIHQQAMAAEGALFLRQQALLDAPNADAERCAIQDAIDALLVVRCCEV
jgi:hypothetical protein